MLKRNISKSCVIFLILIGFVLAASVPQVTAQGLTPGSHTASSGTFDEGQSGHNASLLEPYSVFIPIFHAWAPREILLVHIPAGEFIMGSNSDGDPATSPQRKVYLDGFYIFETMVTNAQFAEFVSDTGYETTAEKVGWSLIGQNAVRRNGAYWAAPKGPGSSLYGMEDYPVLHVSWIDAHAFCTWYGGRLPTEAEWEKAARGPNGRIYPWGGTPVTGKKANFCDVNCPYDVFWKITTQNDGYATVSPVGIYPDGASSYGVLDMAGNLNEWVNDWYAKDYYKTAPKDNPTGPSDGSKRVERGGSWMSGWMNLRTFHRNKETENHSHDLEGFRCVVPETP